MRYVYFAVEGPHDLEFVARFLKLHGLERIRFKPDLAPFWWPVLPTSWPSPPEPADLLKRVDVPTFFQNDAVSVAIDSVTGDGELVRSANNIRNTVNQPGGDELEAIGIVLDSDEEVSANERFTKISTELAAKQLPLAVAPGRVVEGPPRLGIFVLPDNVSAGTLEDLLIECAAKQYPQLLASARTHVDSMKAEIPPYTKKDLKDFKKPAGRRKAIVGSIGSILRPGKAIQTSIQDNRWIDGEALELPRVKTFRDFIDALLALPPAPPVAQGVVAPSP